MSPAFLTALLIMLILIYSIDLASSERGFKCFGCLAGPALGSTSPSDTDCESGNLGRGDQYICSVGNSRNSKTLEFLSPHEVQEMETLSAKADVEYSFGCAKGTFKSIGNGGKDLLTLRGCILDTYAQFEAICDTKIGNETQSWLELLKLNPANLTSAPIQDLLAKEAEVAAELCTCYTDACNRSSGLVPTIFNLFLGMIYFWVGTI